MRGFPVVVGFLALVSSCGFNPHPKNGKLPCDNGCPSGYICGEGNRCWLNGANPDASSSGGTGGSSADALVGSGETGGGSGASGIGGGGGGMGGSGSGSGGSFSAQSGTGTGGVGGQSSILTGGAGGQSVAGTSGTGVASGGSGVGGNGTGGKGGTITTGGATRTGGTGGTGTAGGPGGAGGSGGGSSGGGGTTVAGGTTAIGGTTKTGGTTVTGGTGANTGGGGNADTGGSMSTGAGGTSSAGGTITVTCPAATSYPDCSLTTGVVTGNACKPNPPMFALDANCNIGLWASDGISNGYFYQPWCNNATSCTLTMTCATNSMHITGSYLGSSAPAFMYGNAGWGANLQTTYPDAGPGCQMIDGTGLTGLTLHINVTTLPTGNHLYVGISLANGNSADYAAVLTAGAQTVRIPWACFKNEKACGSIPGPGITSFYYVFDWFSDGAAHPVDLTVSNVGFY